MKNVLLFLAMTFWFSTGQLPVSPDYIIKGIVLDDQGSPLAGASVTVRWSNLGTVTDEKGRFVLNSKKECVYLVIEFPGFQTLSVPNACSGTQLKLNMIPKIMEIREQELMLDSTVPAMERVNTTVHVRGIASTKMAVMSAGEAQPNFNTEDYDVINENRFYEVTQNPLSTFSIDVDAASYANMRRFIQNGQHPPKDAIRIEELVNYFNYEYPEPQGEHPFEVITEISECPWQSQHRLVHIGLQGRHIPMEYLPASNLVFLIDVSGSMDMPNKLPLLQSSFKLLVDQLRPQDRVAVVVYAGAAGLVLPSTSGADKIKIKDAISQLQAGGSTAGGAGIKLAYQVAREHFIQGGNNRVILATDGDFNVGVSSDADLVRMIEQERESGVFLTVLGFGMGNYKDNKMQQLADSGNGNHGYIDNISEAKKVLVSEFGGTMFTIAKDVKLQIEFNPAKVRGYRLIGYENRILDKEDFNDDKKDAGELGSGHTVTAMYEIIPVGVESPFLAKVDDLKYQTTRMDPGASRSKELFSIKLRYKEPDGQQSRMVEHPVTDTDIRLDQTSGNFRWAAAVAEFGMLLRQSEFRGEATYAHCKRLAEGAQGKDPNGYRREFINMIDVMKSLNEPETVRKN